MTLYKGEMSEKDSSKKQESGEGVDDEEEGGAEDIVKQLGLQNRTMDTSSVERWTHIV
jgi:hypothetical protein